jgi:hypothetical protein
VWCVPIAADYFGGTVGTQGNVNLLATSYLVMYLPGTIIEVSRGVVVYRVSTYQCVSQVIITKKYNLRTTLLMGGLHIAAWYFVLFQ